MSGSETGAVMPPPFTLGGVHNSPPPPQSMHLSYTPEGTALYKPVSSSPPAAQYHQQQESSVAAVPVNVVAAPQQQSVSASVNAGAGELVKKKRGRPRKYGPDGSMALTLTSPPSGGPLASQLQSPQPQHVVNSPIGGSASGSEPKKGRGRPLGSSKKHQMKALVSAGIGFTPHIIDVKAGEDVSSKIMAFSQNGPRAVCILSANGAISNVTLHQAATSGGTATYEGRFDILSLSGSFLLSEVGGQRSRTGGLSVSLSGPDGRVLGGCVAGLLIAASPVQVIVGSFVVDGQKGSKATKQSEPVSAAAKLIPGSGAIGPSSPQSRGTLSESSGGPGSPLNQSTGALNNNFQGMSSMPWK
ncbi:hypothetical protein DCAR_0519207 [Daucus carota subsp. sativus]|uniref:AT-hook motif nuclear-localized protein n=1 Tax=Daucus carota subsp. sativus TaxID=79200 RepID=A0AAF0X3M8_DAUCS|nr:hypothetical protein DCAR_0519207 [Daucus carota subsp. sativus]